MRSHRERFVRDGAALAALIEQMRGSGNGTFTGDWQAQFLGPTSSACATVIDLRGAGVGNVKLRYYAN